MYTKILPVIFSYLQLVLISNIGVVCGDDDATLKPVVYTVDNFQTEIVKSHHFVKFYAPWCGHCKRLAPTWEDLAEKFHSESQDDAVTIAKVDCTSDTSVCADQDVAAYPTLKFFKKGSDKGTKYNGPRDLKSLSNFIHTNLDDIKGDEDSEAESEKPAVPVSDDGLVELTDATFKKFTEHGQHFVKFYAPWCGHCQKLAPTWENLAESLKHDPAVKVSKIDCTENRATCGQLEVKGYPTLYWIKDGKKVEKYQGARTHEDLKEFVSKMRETHEEQTADSSDDDAEHDKPTPVVELTDSNFKSVIEKDVTFIKFFAPWCGHCKALAPTWEEMGTKFITNPNIVIAKVDCTTQQQLCKDNNVDGYPTLLIYSKGKLITEYDGGRALEDLISFVKQHIPAHDEL